MSHASYIIGDVFAVMADMPDNSVDLVLTSPPFLALRSYLPADHPDKHMEIGSEPTPAEFLDTLLALTAEWERLLAPHGSIAVELGDTYSGSSGPMYDARPERAHTSYAQRAHLTGWPLDKSLCIIPELYAASLAYGRNVLTGEPSATGQWRVRNLVRWVRPNPPVGALGDKFRPATSVMVVACKARDRWFDLDDVRTDNARVCEQTTANDKGGIRGPMQSPQNPAGAPPLDWWNIPTEGYKGSHYATWPRKVCEIPIRSMCPRHVCMDCHKPLLPLSYDQTVRGMPRADPTGMDQVPERQEEGPVLLESVFQPEHGASAGVHEGLDTRPEGLHPRSGTGPSDGEPDRLCDAAPAGDGRDAGQDADGRRGRAPHQRSEGRQQARESGSAGEAGSRPEAEAPRVAHNGVSPLRDADSGSQSCPNCGSRNLRPGRVLDPFAGSGTTLAVATGHGRDAIGIDLDARNADLAAERVGMFLSVEG